MPYSRLRRNVAHRCPGVGVRHGPPRNSGNKPRQIRNLLDTSLNVASLTRYITWVAKIGGFGEAIHSTTERVESPEMALWGRQTLCQNMEYNGLDRAKAEDNCNYNTNASLDNPLCNISLSIPDLLDN